MFVAAKDRTSMFNTGMVSYIYIGEDRKTVKAVAGPRETVYRLGFYRSESEAAAAFRILAGEMEKGRDIVYMPTDEEVERWKCLYVERMLDRSVFHAMGKSRFAGVGHKERK